MARRAAALCTAALMAAALLSAAPSPALAGEDDPVIGQSGDQVTYIDPSLAGESTTTVEGTLQVAHVDRLDRAGRPGSELAYAVRTDDGESVRVQIAEDLPASAANGAVEAEIVDAGSGPAQVAEATVVTASEAAGSGAQHRAYVVRVSRSGSLPSESAIAKQLTANVLTEWQVESEGAIASFTVDRTATLAASEPASQSKADLCAMADPFGLWNDGAAQFPDVDFGAPGNHLIMIVSGSGCAAIRSTTLGIGTIGRGLGDGGSSSLLWDPDYVDATGVHELGHNFSLGHANVEGAEYYDLYSVMGFGTPGGQAPALDSLFRDRLGISDADEVAQPVDGTVATYGLTARGLGYGLRGIAATDPVTKVTYWIDYRTGVGRDLGSSYADTATDSGEGLRYGPGVVVYRRAADYANSGDIDVVKREAGAVDDTSWTAGQQFTSPSGGVTVSVRDVAGTSASVKVAINDKTFSASPPGIAGTAKVGRTLRAVESYSPAPTSYRYQWYWRDSRAIKGATSSTFTVPAAQRGERLRVRVTGVRDGYRSRSITSASSRTVVAGTFTATAPSIRGSARVGSTLRAAAGTYSPRPSSYRYRWYSGRTAIKGATSKSYRVPTRYRGTKLRVRVTGVRGGYVSKNTISRSTSAVRG